MTRKESKSDTTKTEKIKKVYNVRFCPSNYIYLGYVRKVLKMVRTLIFSNEKGYLCSFSIAMNRVYHNAVLKSMRLRKKENKKEVKPA